MKKIIYSVLSLSIIASADLSVNQIEGMVGKIHEERQGIKLETLQNTKEPFIRMQVENNVTIAVLPSKVDEAKMILHAIMNGKAYINDQWYKLEDKVMGYTLKHIGKRGVVLRNDNSIKKLFLYEEKNNVIQIEERK